MKKRVLLIIICAFLMLLICSCNSKESQGSANETPENVAKQNENSSLSSINITEQAVHNSLNTDNSSLSSNAISSEKVPSYDPETKLTAKELIDFELLRIDWTEKQMLDEGFELKENGEFERIYSKGFVEYYYGNELGNGTTPDWVTINGNIDMPGPRGIIIGDRFEDVFAKFPHEKNWQDSEGGVFYGEFEQNDDQPYSTGAVSESGDTKEISIWPQEGIPCLTVYFENDKVVSYTIEMQYLNP